MNAILHKLLFMLNQEKEGSSFYSIALNLLKNLQTLDTITIEHIAEICNVSIASVSRFCREIGYEDFSDFKYCLKYDIDEEIYSNRLSGKNINYEQSIDEYQQFYFSEIAQNTRKLLDDMDYDAIDLAVNEIYNHKHVIAIGLLHSEFACMVLQAKMQKLDKIIITLMDPRDQYNYLHNANEKTLILIFSLTGNYPLLNLFKKDRNDVYKKDSSAKLILFTNCKDFNHPEIIDHVVYLGGTVSTDAYKFLNNNSLDIAVDAIVYRYGNLLARLPNDQN